MNETSLDQLFTTLSDPIWLMILVIVVIIVALIFIAIVKSKNWVALVLFVFLLIILVILVIAGMAAYALITSLVDVITGQQPPASFLDQLASFVSSIGDELREMFPWFFT